MSIDKAIGYTTLFCKQFYASAIVIEVRLGLNNTNNKYSETGNNNKDEITNTIIEDLKSKFGTDNNATDNYFLPNMYWLLKMHKKPIKARLLVTSTYFYPLFYQNFNIFYKQIEN